MAPTTAQAATQARDDPSDAPAGPSGKADLRRIDWSVAADSAILTVVVDASTYGIGERALLGVHVLLDADLDGIADHEIEATRNTDGVNVDVVLRDLDRTLSTGDCQDLAGTGSAAPSTVTTTIADGLESFTFSFDPALVPGNLVAFRWAAFGQAPPEGAGAGPWDLLPDAANPDPGAANPGDRRCDSVGSGLRVRMNSGIAFPDAPATPGPTPEPEPTPQTPDTTKPSLSALSLSRARFRAGVGTRVSYRLSEAAAVSFRIVGLRGGFVRQGKVGPNSFRFRGRLRGRKLKSGRYRLRVVATDPAGNSSRAEYVRFRIVRR